MRNLKLSLFHVILCILAVWLISCRQETKKTDNSSQTDVYQDTPFVQEFHDAYQINENKADNEVRSIAVDLESNVWIATASGVFRKNKDSRIWEQIITGESRGPAYAVSVNPNGDVLMGTWDGIYRYYNHQLKKEVGVKPPISEICNDGAGNYALGPFGIWRYKNNKWEQQKYQIARTVRDAITDSIDNLWVATDAGLYRCKEGKTTLYQDVSELISCYVRAISFDPSGNIWAGVM